MAILPGWDRDRLRTASVADVEAARLQVYVRELRPLLTADFETQIDDLRDRSAREQELHDKRRRREDIEGKKAAWRLQRELRQYLGLDEPTEVAADG